jgi:hypothetical protein
MTGLLEASRVPISVGLERAIVETARAEGVRLDQLRPVPVGRDTVLEDVETARRVLGRAVERWREVAPSWVRLNFAMQHQCQDFWCWAATSVSVSVYYDPRAGWTQCAMVNAERELTTCCEDGATRACDAPNKLSTPLRRADVLDRMHKGAVDYDVIRREIDAGRPVGLRVEWSETNGTSKGHFIVIEGYQSSGDERVAVEDPQAGSFDLPFTTLTEGLYQGTGSWTHTYFTRPQRALPLARDEIRLASEIWERVRAEDSVVEERAR